MAFKKEVNFRPSKNGSDVQIVFYLKGERGVIQFIIGTGWFRSDHKIAESIKSFYDKPRAWDLGYHSPVPMYDGQQPISHNCSVIDGICFYDGSTLNAEPILDTLITNGSISVWRAMAQYYYSIFGIHKHGRT